jgi:hypothetical protein
VINRTSAPSGRPSVIRCQVIHVCTSNPDAVRTPDASYQKYTSCRITPFWITARFTVKDPPVPATSETSTVSIRAISQPPAGMQTSGEWNDPSF